MNVTVDSLRFTDNGELVIKKSAGWYRQICMQTSREHGLLCCGLHCPLCNLEYDGCVTLCQDRVLLPQHTEEPEKK